ncbi:hypothetical protein ACIXEI_21630 [Bacteroides fragilis]
MQEAIEDKTVSFNLDKEKKDLSNRLELVKEGSEEELELRQRLLLVERAREVYYADKTGEDVVAIQEKYDKKSIDLMAKFADLRNKKTARAIFYGCYNSFSQYAGRIGCLICKIH